MDIDYVEHCYVALELSQRSWLIGYLLPGSTKVQTQNVAGGDTDALLEVLSKIASKCQRETGSQRLTHALRVCFEAGYDGFWLARFLIDRDVDTG